MIDSKHDKLLSFSLPAFHFEHDLPKKNPIKKERHRHSSVPVQAKPNPLYE